MITLLNHPDTPKTAMALGKPVVANEEITEQKEVIEESGGGILVKFNAESFANGIFELLDNPERAKERGKKGHEGIVKNMSYKNMAREVEKTIELMHRLFSYSTTYRTYPCCKNQVMQRSKN